MKKKVFNVVQAAQRGGKPGNWLTVNPKTGSILFSPDFSKVLQGKKINIIQDEDKPKDWYVEPSTDAQAIPLRVSEKLKRCFIQSATISRAILESCGFDSPQRMIIAAEPSDKMYAIITKSAVTSVRGGGANQRSNLKIAA